VLTACLGKGAGKAGEGTGAEIAPADSIAFVSLNADRSRSQWQEAARLAARVPELKNAVTWLTALGTGANTVQTRIGKTVDVAVLPASSRKGGGVVIMTKPKNMTALRSLLASLRCPTSTPACRDENDRVRKGAKAKTSRKVPVLTTREHNGWLLVANSGAVLDRFTSEAKKGTLIGSHAFLSAFKSLSKDALVRVYLRGDESLRLAASRLSGGLLGLGSSVAATKSPFDWIALSLRPDAAGFRLDGTVSGVEATNALNPLPGEAPADSLFAATVAGSSFGLEKTLAELVRKTPKQLVQLGLTVEDLTNLSAGRLSLSVVGGVPLPQRCALSPLNRFQLLERSGFALELRMPGVVATARKLERLLPLVTAQLRGHMRNVTIADAPAVELTVGAVRLYIGAVAGKIFVASASSIALPGSRLATTAVFLRARRVLQVPAENAGVLYANLEGVASILAGSSVPTTKDQAQAGCSGVTKNRPADRSALLAYLSESRGGLRIKGVLSAG
jgi:hypothetical protein